MSHATRTTTAQRAAIAAHYIRRGQTNGRAFDDCFEMGDGAEVVALLLKKAERCPTIRAFAVRSGWGCT